MPHKDPSSLSFQSAPTRRLVLASYWALILLAVPLWWHTTSIERLALPSARVAQALAAPPLRFPVDVHISGASSRDISELREALGSCEGVDVAFHAGEGQDQFGRYSVSIDPNAPPSVHGRHLSLPDVSNLASTLKSLLAPPDEEAGRGRAVGYAPRVRLAFSLLNEDASAGGGSLAWEVGRAIEQTLAPTLASLSTLHNFTIESQVQFHAPLAFTPSTLPSLSEDAPAAYGLTREDLTVFVNSAEWTLSSSATNDPVLNFVLFVPAAGRRPLWIVDGEGHPSPSTAFLLPQWGGIVLHNPAPDAPESLTAHDLAPTMAAFKTQLLLLLGVPPLPPNIAPRDGALTGWQTDALTRLRAAQNTQTARATLGSIVSLVAQIGNMPVGRAVRADVRGALGALEAIATGGADTLGKTAAALALSARAFFAPGMLGLLYFPAEHTAAVYTPLFASVAVPLVAAVVREGKLWRAERRGVVA
ncbi:hypothetical protein HWV62_35286 [Athelia sp. TMB]|nr:hypothetical protein HWV62_35286 [Athelia sp. TMB]